jgi:hypothetical protein
MRVLTPARRDVWEEVLRQDAHSLADHHPRWFDALRAGGQWADASRLYEFDDGRRFVLPLMRRLGPAGTGGWFSSPPPAWGIGGLVGADQDRDVVRQVVEDLGGLRALRIWIRPDPVRAELWQGLTAPGIVTMPRYAHVVDLTPGIETIEGAFNKNTRRGLKKADAAGVKVELDHSGALLQVHYDLYLRSVERWSERQREPLRLAMWRARRRDPLEKLQALAAHLGSDFCQFVAYHDEVPAASSILVIGRSAHETRGVMDRDVAGPVRANDILQVHALRHAADRGCHWYHLGESGGSDSLAAFKERFGAVGHSYAEVRIERLPVTRADTAARTAVKRVIGFRDA